MVDETGLTTNKLLEKFLHDTYAEDLQTMINFGTKKVPKSKKYFWMSKVYDEKTSPSYITELPNDNDIWLISDIHFFHTNIINYSDRPYDNVTDMNEQIVNNINECVKPEDTLLFLGDLSFKGIEKTQPLLDEMNGKFIHVVGNHDFDRKKLKKFNVDELHMFYGVFTPEYPPLFCTHYPLYEYNIPTKPVPMINVHGHIHDKPEPSTRHINVSVENINYKPINIKDVLSQAYSRMLEWNDEC